MHWLLPFFVILFMCLCQLILIPVISMVAKQCNYWGSFDKIFYSRIPQKGSRAFFSLKILKHWKTKSVKCDIIIQPPEVPFETIFSIIKGNHKHFPKYYTFKKWITNWQFPKLFLSLVGLIFWHFFLIVKNKGVTDLLKIDICCLWCC